MYERQTLLDNIQRKLNNNKVFVLTWVLIVSITTVASLISGFKYIFTSFNDKFGEKQILYKKIEKLNTKVSIDYIKDIFGTPTITKTDKSKKETTYIYVNKYSYIQILTNDLGTVDSYAITSRIKDFKPNLKIRGLYEKDLTFNLKLNSDHFSKISPLKCYYLRWPKGFVYLEGDYLGGNGNYQSYYIGINDVGYIANFESFKLLNLKDSMTEIKDCNNISEKFRNNTVFNTFMLTSNSEESAMTNNDVLRIGVSSLDIGLID